MIKKKFYSWHDVEKMCLDITNQMYRQNWKPDYIIGITRGGNVPATIISNMIDVRCEALKVSLRDDSGHGNESNSWMAEDALGQPDQDSGGQGKNILIVDDINDTGATFKWIWDDWKLEKLHKVKFASLTENLASNFEHVSYHVHEVNKVEEDIWLVYPWENVGDYNV